MSNDLTIDDGQIICSSPMMWTAPCGGLTHPLSQRVKFGGNEDLVGGWATPLKNLNVNWDDYSLYIWENIKWQPNHQPEIGNPEKTITAWFEKWSKKRNPSGPMVETNPRKELDGVPNVQTTVLGVFKGPSVIFSAIEASKRQSLVGASRPAIAIQLNLGLLNI